MTLPTFGPHLLASILTNNPSFTTMDTAIALKASLEPYFITCVPCILLSIMTVSLNIFVINYYRKTKFTLVPLLYTMISGVDILTAVGVIRVVIGRVIKSSAEGTRFYDPTNNALIFRRREIIKIFPLKNCTCACILADFYSRDNLNQ